mgnify:CR=1 FL=1
MSSKANVRVNGVTVDVTEDDDFINIAGLDYNSDEVAPLKELWSQYNDRYTPDEDRPAVFEAFTKERERLQQVVTTRQEMKLRHLANMTWWDIVVQRFMSPIIRLCNMHQIHESDIAPLPYHETAETVTNEFARMWQKEIDRSVQDNKRPWMLRALLESAWRPLMIIGFFEVGFYAVTFASPYVLDQLTTFLRDASNGEDTYAGDGIGLAFALAIIAWAAATMNVYKAFYCTQLGQRTRSMVMQSVFNKSIAIAPSASQEITSGEVMNLMANDAQKLGEAAQFVHLPWIAPTVITLCTLLLWAHIGVSAIVAVLLMMVLFPYEIVMARLVRTYRVKALSFTDARVRQVNEMLQGVRVIKLNAWEEAVREQLRTVREQELYYLRVGIILRMINNLIMFIWPPLVTYFTSITYANIEGNTLNAKTIFIIHAFLNVARFPITLLPYGMQVLVETLVATKRVGNYLTRAELPQRPLLPAPGLVDMGEVPRPPATPAAAAAAASLAAAAPAPRSASAVAPSILSASLSLVPAYASRFAIAMRHAAFSWSRDPLSGDRPPVLADVSLALLPGSLSAVVGPVGVGKSSLISALLGEMHLHVSGDWAVGAGALPAALTSQERALWMLVRQGRLTAPSQSRGLAMAAATLGSDRFGMWGDISPAAAADNGDAELASNPAALRAPMRGGPANEEDDDLHLAHAFNGNVSCDASSCAISADTGLPLPQSFTRMPASTYSTALPPPPPLAASGPRGRLMPAALEGRAKLDCSDPRVALELVCLRGRVGYLAQDPWIMHATIRDNITVGLPFSPARFNAVVAATALDSDLATLSSGADTIVGEQGVTLSGGQKARVALARVMYRSDMLDVVLLDDPFSAIDQVCSICALNYQRK